MESKGNTRGENNCEIAFSRVACACAGLHILKKYITHQTGSGLSQHAKVFSFGHTRTSQPERKRGKGENMDDRGRAYDGVGGGVCMRARAVTLPLQGLQYTAYTPATRRARSMFPRAGDAHDSRD